MAKTTLTVDGRAHTVAATPDTPLLYVLREELALNGPKFGCGLAQCGTCTVLIDGRAVRSCVTPVAAVNGAVRTLEGLSAGGKPHPVQDAFIAEDAAHCGYCATGWLMNSVALLEKHPKPSEAQIRDQLSGLKCRCGTHMAILRAVRRAAAATA